MHLCDGDGIPAGMKSPLGDEDQKKNDEDQKKNPPASLDGDGDGEILSPLLSLLRGMGRRPPTENNPLLSLLRGATLLACVWMGWVGVEPRFPRFHNVWLGVEMGWVKPGREYTHWMQVKPIPSNRVDMGNPLFSFPSITREIVAGFWISPPSAPHRALGGTTAREARMSLRQRRQALVAAWASLEYGAGVLGRQCGRARMSADISAGKRGLRSR